jgi:plastocyanin
MSRRPVALWLLTNLLAFALNPDAGWAGSLRGVVSIGGKGLRDAVVALSPDPQAAENSGLPVASPPDAAQPFASQKALMNQKNLAFRPRVLPVLRGTTVEFPNQDDVAHNVFSPTSVNGPFDLGTYGGGQSRSIRLNQAGEVRVLCNIHMEMEGHILVLDDPYFAVSAGEGSYQINDLPPGAYTIRVWRGRWFNHTQRIVVADPADLVLDLKVER